MITVSSGYPCDNKIQILKITKALDTLSCYLFRFTIQTQREHSSQCQRTLVRLLSLSVLGYLNITLASNQNNSASASVNQGSVDPSGSANLFPITDSTGEGATSASATTQFIADKNVVSASKILPTQIDRLIYDSSSDQLAQDVKTFLAKPVVLLSGTLNTTDTFSSFPTGYTPFDNFAAAPQILKPKIEGYLGFRATTVFRLVVNANRFQQGRYLLSYLHLGGVNAGSVVSGDVINDHMNTLVQRTTLPHVEIDLCCDTEATLKIPYNSAMNFYPFTLFTNTGNQVGAWGSYHISPYEPIAAATGNQVANFTLYSWFEDVTLVGAIVPQSSRNVFSSKKSRKSDTEIEQDSADIGPISSALIRVRDASNILSRVPLLSSYASGVSWFADIGASTAKVFGWSKPVNLESSNRMTQNYLPYAANTDGPDMSFPLSLSYTNSVGTANGFSGTDVDEMDFSFLATIPVFMRKSPWAVADVSGTQLADISVSPLDSTFTSIANSTTFKHYSPLQLIASHFQYWRGSIVYKLKFVKTEFHSGRLIVAFLPQNLDVSIVGLTAPVSVYTQRHIIDIRETNEFTFVVPYIADSPYRTNNTGFSDSVGQIRIFVLDPLVAPATVSQTVQIIIEKAGGPDMEFAVPQPCVSNYFTGVVPQSGVDQAPNVCSNADTSIGSTLIKEDNHLNSLHCVGEKIRSFRALLKLPNHLIPVAAPTVANYLNVVPFGVQCGTVIFAVNTPPSILSDLYARLASCYVYSRGGVRIKFLDNMAVTTTQPIAVTLDTRPGSTTTRSSLFSWSASNSAGTANTTDHNNMPISYYRAGYSGEVQVPQYHRYHSRVNSDCMLNTARPYNSSVPYLAPRVFVTRATIPVSSAGASVLRSISDDGNFGCFTSVPPMTDITSLVP
jgi:hypothetical protein